MKKLYTVREVAKICGRSHVAVLRYIRSCKIKPIVKISGGMKQFFLRKKMLEQIRNAIRDSNYRVPCKACGLMGHTEKRCPESKHPARCTMCGKEKPRSEFRRTKRTLPNGKVTPFLLNVCKLCDIKRGRERYRSSFRNRLASLNASIAARCRKGPRHTGGKTVPYSIDLDYLMVLLRRQKGKCFYTGKDLSLETGRWAISLDRKNPDRGYIKGNVVFCTWLVNQMKRDCTVGEFMKLCREVLAIHG